MKFIQVEWVEMALIRHQILAVLLVAQIPTQLSILMVVTAEMRRALVHQAAAAAAARQR